MEKRFKLRFSRIFQASFFSCRSKKNSDIIIEKPISEAPRNLRTNYPIISSETSETFPRRKVSKITETFPRRKISENFSPFLGPTASPISPLKSAPLSHLRDCLSREKIKIKNKNKNPNSAKLKRKKNPTRLPAAVDFGGAWWYGGGGDETEDETETLFSSRSLTSDSSVSRRRRQRERRNGRRRSERKVEEGFFAVVKNSSNPYKDFKASMAEMIVEKQIFGAKELEELLQCFISLNSRHYHRLIFEAYSEIKEALFFL